MDKIYVAKLGKTVGLHGSMKIYIDSDFPEQFQANAQFKTQKNKTLIVESFNPNNSTIKFKEIDSVEDAKKLTNSHLFSTSEDTIANCKLDENQYFWFDLIGCMLEENGEKLGTIIDIQRLPLEDYFLIETTKELQELNLSKQFMLPYNEQYILQVDIENKTILTKEAKDILEAS